jgi:hypothetical protein
MILIPCIFTVTDSEAHPLRELSLRFSIPIFNKSNSPQKKIQNYYSILLLNSVFKAFYSLLFLRKPGLFPNVLSNYPDKAGLIENRFVLRFSSLYLTTSEKIIEKTYLLDNPIYECVMH